MHFSALRADHHRFIGDQDRDLLLAGAAVFGLILQKPMQLAGRVVCVLVGGCLRDAGRAAVCCAIRSLLLLDVGRLLCWGMSPLSPR